MTKTTKIIVIVVVAVTVFTAGFAIAASRTDRSSAFGHMMNGSMMGGGSMMNGSMMNGSMMNGPMMGTWTTGQDSAPPAAEGARQAAVSMNDLRFSPSTITATVNERVNVVVRNDDSIVHDFTVPTLGIHVTVQPGQQTTFGLPTANAGTFPFRCTVPGHATAGMQGSIAVGS